MTGGPPPRLGGPALVAGRLVGGSLTGGPPPATGSRRGAALVGRAGVGGGAEAGGHPPASALAGRVPIPVGRLASIIPGGRLGLDSTTAAATGSSLACVPDTGGGPAGGKAKPAGGSSGRGAADVSPRGDKTCTAGLVATAVLAAPTGLCNAGMDAQLGQIASSASIAATGGSSIRGGQVAWVGGPEAMPGQEVGCAAPPDDEVGCAAPPVCQRSGLGEGPVLA